ncbi:SRPBCC domain-containing protein [Umezawaea endophytica]|uniref:SRPBCC domain-containing protein n=1 Tax=Umezawaea endophytica TaxID=1654476 RepID=A0A9X2VND0_9PSEU|nr:SRPBCC domain-containing protein [Umezawaea endophytica]MCS7479304.1 SRPBCC domain-containing protein [Umezawaea endophytica]
MSVIEVVVAAPVDTVWEALRDKEKIRQWHGWDFDGLDAEVDHIYLTDVVEDGRTLALGGGDRFSLTPSGTSTLVTLDRAPLGGNPELDAYHDAITEGWTTFLQQLRFALERQPGAVRRTLFFEGGFPDLAHVDSRWTADLVGEPVTGELWFRSANQVGVTVDSWGEGLLVVVDAPSAMVVLSTYGLDEAAFGDLEARWSKRFAG